MDRYRITVTPDGRRYGILDRELYGWCTLLDEEGKNLLPLEWGSRKHAEAWLNMCYRTWNAWESGSAVPEEGALAPRRWRPHPPAQSPWDRAYD